MPNPLSAIGSVGRSVVNRVSAAAKALIFPGGVHTPGWQPPRPIGTVDETLAGLGSTGVAFIPTNSTGGTLEFGVDTDEARAGPLWKNSAVAIALGWINENFPLADPTVERRQDLEGSGEGGGEGESSPEESWEKIPDHQLLSLLYDPVPSFGAFDYYGLMGGALLSALTDGNGYWIKQRDNADRVRELWWVPHTNIEPVRLDPRKPDYLYLYRVWIEGEPKPIDQLIEPRDIVHFKWGSPDTDNDLKACAPLKRCLKEVASDGQVASYTSSILWNMGVPGLLMIFQDRKQVSEDQAEELKAKMKRVFGGRKRGDSAVLAGPVTIEKPGFSPDEMALTEIGKIPEARICAAIGVPPMILGLSVGDEQRSYANYAAAEKVAWRRLRSVQGRMAEAIYRQLLPDFAQDRADLRIGWDYTNVEALQEDRDAAARRSVLLYKGRVAKRAEARKMVGLPVAEDGSDDVYDSAPAPMIAAKSESSTNSGVMNGRGSQADGVPTSDDRGAESETNGKRIGMLGGHVPGGNGQGHHGSEGGDYLSVGRWSMGITPQERFGFLRGFDGAEHGGSHKGEGNGAGNGLGDGGSGSGPELAPGQPAWPAQWEADHEPDAEDVPGASDGVQGKAIVDWRDGGGNIMDGEPGPHAGDGGTPGSDQLECKDSRGVDATAVEVCDGSGSGDHQGVEGGASR